MLTQLLVASVTQPAHAASAHGGMHHSMGPYSVAASVFPYVSVGFLYIKRAILRRRYRREAEASEFMPDEGWAGVAQRRGRLLSLTLLLPAMSIVAPPVFLQAQPGPPRETEAPPPRVSFDAQARMRAENWSNFGLSSGVDREDAFVLGRVMLGMDVRFGRHVRGYVQARSSFLSERNLPGGNRPADQDHLDLQNGFLDISLPLAGEAPLVLRAGRQELLFGRERLVSPADWANTRLTFDGARAILDSQNWSVHAFFVRPVQIKLTDFNWSDETCDFYGVYATRVHSPGLQYDLYWLALDRDSVAFNGSAGRERRHTVGARLAGKSESGWDYDLELAYQAGDVSNADISAYMIGSQIGWTFPDAGWAPRIFGEFDYGSGDDEPGGEVNTFNPLFASGHKYLGHVDALGRRNVAAISGGVRLMPLSRLTVTLQAHRFWRASEEDSVYSPSGAIVRQTEPGASKDLGSEIDALVSYGVRPGLTASVGYGRFESGPFLEQTGPSEDPQLLYGALEWKSGEQGR
ncbi:MAG: alginate export family protein [Gemmatimonadota bacterium]